MRFLLTRPKGQCTQTKKKLEAKGHTAFLLPLIEIKPPKDGGRALREAVKNISQYRWLILTSQNSETAVRRTLKKFPKNLKIVRVGREGVSGLIRYFKNKKVAGQKFFYPMSQIGRKELVRFLRKKGAVVKVIPAYQTVPAKVSPQKLRQVLKKIEAVLFFSPSAVGVFFGKISRKNPLLKKLRFFPIGETTGKAIKEQGYRPFRLRSRLRPRSKTSSRLRRRYQSRSRS